MRVFGKWLGRLLLKGRLVSEIDAEALAETVFPLGELMKGDVRRIARDRGLAGRPDVGALVLYMSEEAHYSIEKGAIVAGILAMIWADFDRPWNKLPRRHRDLLLHGSKGKKIAMTVKF